jgi:predicted small lipoprotein YifL
MRRRFRLLDLAGAALLAIAACGGEAGNLEADIEP